MPYELTGYGDVVEWSVDVPEYTAAEGLRFAWDDDARIEVGSDADGSVVIAANRAGLVTLARHLLTLAQDEVPSGSHLHLEDDTGLEGGSIALVLARS
jgi:hypothetical protein